MQAQRLAQLLFNGMKGVQRCHRLLKDKAYVIAPNRAQPRLRRADQAFAAIAHLARYFGRIGQKRYSRKRSQRFA